MEPLLVKIQRYIDRLTVNSKLLLSTLLIILIGFSLAEVYHLQNDYEEQLNSSRVQTELLANSHAAAIAGPVWNFEHDMMSTTLKSLESVNGFISAIVRYPDGKIIYQLKSAHNFKQPNTVEKDIVWFVGDEKRILGKLELTIALDEAGDRFWESIFHSALTLFFLLNIGACVIYFVFHRIASPLDKLTGIIRDIGKGERSVSIPYQERKDEVGKLAHAVQVVNENALALDKLQRSLEAQVATKTKELRAARDAAEAGSKVKSEFLSTVSHELRTPLTSIRGSIGLLKGGATGSLPDKAMQLLEMADRNADRLVHLVNDILDVEKIESGKMEYQFQKIELSQLLKNSVEIHQGYAEQFNVSFELLPTNKEIWVSADPHRIGQVIDNLLSNAAKFSKPGDAIQISGHNNGVTANIIVEDQGCGIPKAFRARIFERFSQADSTDTRSVNGTGLGLSIAHAIITAHGGDISFESRTQEDEPQHAPGTSFRVGLPVVKTSSD